MKKIYISGSLRNPNVPLVAAALREDGHIVFDDWYAAGPGADDAWKAYEEAQGFSLAEALNRPAALHVLDFDRKWLGWADTTILVMPAGKSGHMELAYQLGRGMEGHILFPEISGARWDVMYGLAKGVWDSLEDLREHLKAGSFEGAARKDLFAGDLVHPPWWDEPHS